jgi:hypothetical protein
MGDEGVQAYDPFYDRAYWAYKFAWLPQRCDRTGSRIWLKRGYRGIRIVTGPGEPVIEARWLTRDEFVIGKLKGSL